jgi:hypothetical protein
MRGAFRIPVWLGFCAFLAIALFFLWQEHSAHILGVVPYLLLLACPLMHYFMHRGRWTWLRSQGPRRVQYRRERSIMTHGQILQRTAFGR